jgi:hypothetical protein
LRAPFPAGALPPGSECAGEHVTAAPSDQCVSQPPDWHDDGNVSLLLQWPQQLPDDILPS